MTYSFACPRCGAEIPLSEHDDSGPAFCPVCQAKLAKLQSIQADHDVSYPLEAPPYESKAEILEANDERLMLSIPPGGSRANSLGCFGIIWLSITAAITAGFWFGSKNDPTDGIWIAFLVMGIFWLVGFVMLYFAVRLKYTRGYVFLSADRVVHQQILFQSKKNTELDVTDSTRAKLVEAYQENDVPVYRVEIHGVGPKIKYGTGLSREEKEWFVETVNNFLAYQIDGEVESSAGATYDHFGNSIQSTNLCPACESEQGPDSTICETCGAILQREGERVNSARLRETKNPEQLPADSSWNVWKNSANEWVIHYPIRKLADNSSGGGCLLIFGLIWESFILFMTYDMLFSTDAFSWIFLMFSLPFHIAGLLMLSLGFIALFGGFRLILGGDRSSARWSIGLLGYTMRFSTSSITDVYLKSGGALSSLKNQSNSSPRTSKSDGYSCILLAAGKRIPVTSSATSKESRFANGLIRYCLQDLGHRLQDE